MLTKGCILWIKHYRLIHLISIITCLFDLTKSFVPQSNKMEIARPRSSFGVDPKIWKWRHRTMNKLPQGTKRLEMWNKLNVKGVLRKDEHERVAFWSTSSDVFRRKQLILMRMFTITQNLNQKYHKQQTMKSWMHFLQNSTNKSWT